MKLQLEPSPLPGCCVVHLPRSADTRGTFTKLMHASSFGAHDLVSDFREVYVSTSAANVVRGLHFQTPPHDHAKLVTCLAGTVFDVALDLRRGSPTRGQHFAVELSAETPRALYLPSGFAHGFLALREPATLLYFVSSEYAPSHDQGVRWDSAGIAWPLGGEPILSPRDAGFPLLDEFETPFELRAGDSEA